MAASVEIREHMILAASCHENDVVRFDRNELTWFGPFICSAKRKRSPLEQPAYISEPEKLSVRLAIESPRKTHPKPARISLRR